MGKKGYIGKWFLREGDLLPEEINLVTMARYSFSSEFLTELSAKGLLFDSKEDAKLRYMCAMGAMKMPLPKVCSEDSNINRDQHFGIKDKIIAEIFRLGHAASERRQKAIDTEAYSLNSYYHGQEIALSDILTFVKPLPEETWIEKQEEQKPTGWSEENERIAEIKTFISQCNGFNSANRHAVFRMLDALNPQSQWKPTEEQINALQRAIENYEGDVYHHDIQYLEELLEQLKALATQPDTATGQANSETV